MALSNPSGREIVGEVFLNRGVPKEALNQVLSSLSDNSWKQYSKPIIEWWAFCLKRNISPCEASVNDILKFLAQVFDSCNTYSKLNTYRSAIALISSKNIGSDPIVKRFCKGAAAQKPQAPRYNSTWDPGIVLTYLGTLFPNETLSLEFLSKKLITLLALLTGHRMQTLALIRLSNIVFKPNEAQIKIPDRVKTSGVGREQPFLLIPKCNEKPNICALSTLKIYVSKTQDLRNDESFLCVTFRKPHHQATKQTLSRWVKQTLDASGIDVSKYKTHSTRHASTSAAKRQGVSSDTIRHVAGWTPGSQVFENFYNQPLDISSSFAECIYKS